MGLTQGESRARSFSSGVFVLFATQVAGAAFGVVNGIVLARLLGPALKGDYYILVLLPSTAMILVQLGLPTAFGFFAARGGVSGMVRRSLVLTAGLSVVALTSIGLLLPHLENVFLETAGMDATVMAFLALPLALNATFTTAIVMGRQAVGWYAVVTITYSIVTTVLLVAILGGFGPSVTGAIVVFLVASLVQSAGFTLGAVRVSRMVDQPTVTAFQELFRYGLRFYPSSIMGFFSARIDVFLIAGLIPEAAVPLGLYSMSVGLAELISVFPNAVSSLFFPQVAASTRAEADGRVADVSRVTLLVTGAFALLLVPVAASMIWVLLPAFEASLAPLLVLLPGVVALSIAKVVGGYVTGIGRPGVNSALSIAALVLNVALNLVLIPRLGIVGAAVASLVSYAFNAASLTLYSSRAAGTSLASFWVIRPGDVRFTLATSLALLRRIRSTIRPARDLGAR